VCSSDLKEAFVSSELSFAIFLSNSQQPFYNISQIISSVRSNYNFE